ncbi:MULTISPECIES: hypothetical protein [Moorena]|uniref:Uncharacterized protein n=1 Tax=Moorena producens 3L TaxID=489825 RepID=F4XN95_9CYAN|nr:MULTISPECIES: hypothetical protein [Moorena]EGJ34154.1 hypothetical protein LYNGBM3L_23700 [Moorena producens 3L]NEP69541.1 hypothetical protein [Moorena sp. SIO3A5]NEQ09602.1 hypothetical protein [Moorena sp. SIO4E2]
MKTPWLKLLFFKLFVGFLTVCLVFGTGTPVKASPTVNSCPEGMTFIPGVADYGYGFAPLAPQFWGE